MPFDTKDYTLPTFAQSGLPRAAQGAFNQAIQQATPFSNMASLFTDQLALSQQPLSQSAQVTGTRAALLDALQGQQALDARQLNRTGLRGGELALAFAANRSQALVRGIRQAMQGALQTSLTRENRALAGLQALTGLKVQVDQREKDRSAAMKRALLGLLGGAGQATASFFPTDGGGIAGTEVDPLLLGTS